jgi:hypothetical protein
LVLPAAVTTIRAMADEEREPETEQGPVTKPETDTLTSSLAPSRLRRQAAEVEVSAPKSGASERLEGLAKRGDELEQRLADCELRIAGLYDRLASLEKQRHLTDDRGSRSTKLLLLWVGLIFLFVVIWNFLGPGSEP